MTASDKSAMVRLALLGLEDAVYSNFINDKEAVLDRIMQFAAYSQFTRQDFDKVLNTDLYSFMGGD